MIDVEQIDEIKKELEEFKVCYQIAEDSQLDNLSIEVYCLIGCYLLTLAFALFNSWVFLIR